MSRKTAELKEPTAITIPVLEELPENVYCPRHLEVQLLHEQSRTLKRLARTLESNGEILNNGRPVDAPQRAIMWLLEQM